MNTQKTNVVIFGLTGMDTAEIVRELRKNEKFNVVAWFGLFDDATYNTYQFYEFKIDYDYTIPVPDDLYYTLHNELYNFVDQSTRRYKVKNYWREVFVQDGSIYESLDNYHRYIYFFWELFSKNRVDLVIIDTLPHCAADLILAKIAEYLNIPKLLLFTVPFPNKFMYFTEFVNNSVDFDVYNTEQRPVQREIEEFPLEKREKLYYMTIPPVLDDSEIFNKDDKQWIFEYLKWDIFSVLSPPIISFLGRNNRISKDLKLRFGERFETYASTFSNPDEFFNMPYSPTSYNFRKLWFDLRWDFRKHLKEKNYHALLDKARFIVKYLDYKNYRKLLKENSDPNFSFDAPYVYFPLHYQPELTTQCLGNQMYINQALAIERLAALIPENWFIYVKEHVIQSECLRPQSFFERLKAIPNLKIVPIETNTFELIEHSQFVSTISGTVGWEAIKNGKNVLLFGVIYYQFLPGVFRYREGFELDALLNYTIDPDALQQAVNVLYSRLETGIFSADSSQMLDSFDPTANAHLIIQFFERFLGIEDCIQPSSEQVAHEVVSL